jgi:hypothetical protein
MIAFLAAIAIQQSAVVEVLDESASVVSIQAVVKVPRLDSRQRSVVQVMVSALGEDTKTYSKAQIADVAGRVGSQVRASLSPDHIRIGFSVVPADEAIGISMLGSILKDGRFEDSALERVADDLTFRRWSYWRLAVEGHGFEKPKYSRKEFDDLAAAIFRPENITIGVGGKIEAGVATQKWEDLVADWKPPKLPRLEFREDVENAADSPRLSTIEYVGDSFPARDAAFTTRLLALTALGTGKSAALWEVSREDLGLSYRQEGILSPSADGFLPRLIVATSHKDDLAEQAEKLRTSLVAKVEQWTDVDRKRAMGMAEAYLIHGSDMSPLYFSQSWPVSNSLEDEVFVSAYWRSKTGETWNPYQLLGRMGFVELKDLKETALGFLKNAKIRLHKGS